MTQPVSRKWWLALSIAAALASAPAFAAKDVVVAVGSNFTTLDPYDANDTLSQAVAKSFYQGLFGLDKEMKLQNVLAESYTVSPDGLVYTTWNQTDFVKVSKFDGYWQPGLPKLDSITWRPVVDNNTRAAMLQTGEAQFAFPIPYEQAPLLAKNSKLELVASPSIMQRYISMNVTQKPFDNPKVREAINYAINRQALVKVAFAGYATPATGVVPPSIAYAQTYTAWPYDPAKARQLLKEAGYPNGFSTTLWSSHNHSTAQKVLQFTQQQLAQVGIKAQVTAMDAGQRAAEVEGKGQKESGVRMFYTGWSASTGEADWALSPLFASQNWPPTLFNTAFYSNPQVDNALSEALKTTDPQQKTKLYKEAQDIIWKESPWVPLVVEKLVSAHSKNLTGFYIQPDTGFSFEQADLTP